METDMKILKYILNKHIVMDIKIFNSEHLGNIIEQKLYTGFVFYILYTCVNIYYFV